MEKEFIPYEEALVLKDLGFDEPCFNVYNENGLLIVRLPKKKYFLRTNTENIRTNILNPKIKICSAPLYQQAFRWFREKHNIHTIIAYTSSGYSVFDGGYMVLIDIMEPHKAIDTNETYKTYEEAELTCLRKIIEVIKNK